MENLGFLAKWVRMECQVKMGERGTKEKQEQLGEMAVMGRKETEAWLGPQALLVLRGSPGYLDLLERVSLVSQELWEPEEREVLLALKGDPGEDGAPGKPGTAVDVQKALAGFGIQLADLKVVVQRKDIGLTDKTERGEKGDRGEPGVRGPSGADGGRGFPGDRGAKGEQGERGPAGATGLLEEPLESEDQRGPQGPQESQASQGYLVCRVEQGN
ncbi:hypothetical protein INR49_008397 [Caranx melampygus]|nr:hypothetical protein INR49_008397 [Caranx melampygus]